MQIYIPMPMGKSTIDMVEHGYPDIVYDYEYLISYYFLNIFDPSIWILILIRIGSLSTIKIGFG